MESIVKKAKVFDKEALYILLYLSVLRRYPSTFDEEIINKKNKLQERSDKDKAKIKEYIRELPGSRSDRGLILHETLCDVAFGQCDLLNLNKNKKVNYNSIQIVIEDMHPEVIGVGYVKGIVKRMPVKDFKPYPTSSSASHDLIKTNTEELISHFLIHDYFDYQQAQRQSSLLFSSNTKYVGYARVLDDNDSSNYIVCFLVLEAIGHKDEAYDDLYLNTGTIFTVNDTEIDTAATEIYGALPATHHPLVKNSGPKTIIDTSPSVSVSVASSTLAAATFSFSAAASAFSVASSFMSSSASTTKTIETPQHQKTPSVSNLSQSSLSTAASTSNQNDAQVLAPLPPAVTISAPTAIAASSKPAATPTLPRAASLPKLVPESNSLKKDVASEPKLLKTAASELNLKKLVANNEFPKLKPISETAPVVVPANATNKSEVTETKQTLIKTASAASLISKDRSLSTPSPSENPSPTSATASNSSSSWFGSLLMPIASTIKDTIVEKALNNAPTDDKSSTSTPKPSLAAQTTPAQKIERKASDLGVVLGREASSSIASVATTATASKPNPSPAVKVAASSTPASITSAASAAAPKTPAVATTKPVTPASTVATPPSTAAKPSATTTPIAAVTIQDRKASVQSVITSTTTPLAKSQPNVSPIAASTTQKDNVVVKQPQTATESKAQPANDNKDGDGASYTAAIGDIGKRFFSSYFSGSNEPVPASANPVTSTNTVAASAAAKATPSTSPATQTNQTQKPATATPIKPATVVATATTAKIPTTPSSVASTTSTTSVASVSKPANTVKPVASAVKVTTAAIATPKT